MWAELAYNFRQGNPYMWIMVAIMFLSLVIIFERLFMFNIVYNLNFHKFLTDIKKMILSNDMDRAMSRCKGTSKTSLPKIALRALEAAETDPSTVKGTIEEEAIEFLPKIENRLEALPALATIIMLTGILGTVDGLWDTFHSINVLDTAKKQASLAEGVAVALNPTALGVAICMVILGVHQMLKGSAIKLTEKIHYGVAVLYNVLAPPDMATYIAAPVAEGVAPNINIDASDEVYDEPEETIDDGGSIDDAFDDASVEDIKDEEEII